MEYYANKVDVFANEIHKLAEYIRTNPNNEAEEIFDSVYLDFLKLELEFYPDFKKKHPEVFNYMIQDQQ